MSEDEEITKISFEFVEDVINISSSNKVNKNYEVVKISKKIHKLIEKVREEEREKMTLLINKLTSKIQPMFPGDRGIRAEDFYLVLYSLEVENET